MSEDSVVRALEYWLKERTSDGDESRDIVSWLKGTLQKSETDKDLVINLYEWGKWYGKSYLCIKRFYSAIIRNGRRFIWVDWHE